MLKQNAQMIFVGYDPQDDGVRLHFVCLDPGAGEENDRYVQLTYAELAASHTDADIQTLALAKLMKRYRPIPVLDSLVQKKAVLVMDKAMSAQPVEIPKEAPMEIPAPILAEAPVPETVSEPSFISKLWSKIMGK